MEIPFDPCHVVLRQACVIFGPQSFPLLASVVGILLDESVCEKSLAGGRDLLVAQVSHVVQRAEAADRHLVHDPALDARGVQGAKGERGVPAGGAAEERGALDVQFVEEADDLFGQQLRLHSRVCLGWCGGAGEARHIESEHVIRTVGGEEVRDSRKIVAVAFTGGDKNDVFIG